VSRYDQLMGMIAAMPSEADYAFAILATIIAIPFWLYGKIKEKLGK
jgi:hypothetical protein